jgi:uncharacterized coiled-coil DUF342 family protein
MLRMTEAEKSLATRRDEILAEQMRLAARRNDLCSAFIEIAKKIAAEYPDLSPAGKLAQYDALSHEIEMMDVRAHKNCTRVLAEISRILGIFNR